MVRLGFTGAMLVLLSGCAEPFIVFAGGELSGDEKVPPTEWSFLKAIDTVQIETDPIDPYSVNVWAVGIGADVYVATGEDGTRWTECIDGDSRVRLRTNGDIYPLKASAVTDMAERRRVARAYLDKYDVDDDDGWVDTGKIYRLDRR
ncbi:MAG: hypothetical protein GWM88_01350 [Pseudomonadales bacterium]|nr:hypothetical protein [Pseudomonadales bacterium]NIX06735.1 hypothetical protein [Pseudomonadales bacterium]